jgi:hypothetical protein
MKLSSAGRYVCVASFGLALAATQAIGVSGAHAAGGTVSDTPDQTASFNGSVRAVVYHAGVVYVGGDFTSATDNGQTITRNHVAAIDPGTGHLLPWNPNANGSVYSLAATDTGIYLGGTFGRVGGAAHSRIALVTTAGAVDSGFTASASGNVRALGVLGGTVYAGGTFSSIDGQSRPYLGAVDAASGALVTGWAPALDNKVFGLTIANGWVYAAGGFGSVNGATKGRHLAPLDPTDGSLQAGYTSSINYAVHAVAATPTVLYAAADGPGGHLRAVSVTGAAIWDLTADGGMQAVTILNGAIYAGGHFDNVCTTTRTGSHGVCLDGQVQRKKFAAVDPSGNLLPWAPQANSALGTFSMDSDPVTGRVVAGGEWTTFDLGHISQPHYAQFESD